MDHNKLLEVNGCSFGYGRGNGFLSIVTDLTFSLDKGEFLQIKGRNGCGKTTVIRGILGLGAHKGGSIRFGCKAHRIGYVPQESHLTPDTPATALDILSCAIPDQWGKTKMRAEDLLTKIDLYDKRNTRFGNLSGGQKRRVLLGRALMIDPEVLIMDEPRAFTDKKSSDVMEAIVQELLAKKVGVITVTHSSSWNIPATVLDMENRI